MKRFKGELGLLIVAIIWGSGFVANQAALDHQFTPYQIMSIRFLVASIILGIVFRKRFSSLEKRTVIAGATLGVFLFIGFSLQTFGLLYTTPSKNAFLTATNVVIVPFIGYLLYRKVLDKMGILGSFVALIGIGLLSLNGDLRMSSGDILTLLCAIAFAFHIFYTGEFSKNHDALALTTIQLLTACILSLLLLVMRQETAIPLDMVGLGSTVYLGIFSTTIAFFLQTVAQKDLDETRTAILLSLEAVFGTIFSVIFVHEVLTIRQISGCALIFIAIIIAETKLSFLKRAASVSQLEDIS